MELPFTRENFLEIFKQYNLGIYPLQYFFYFLAAMIVFLSVSKKPSFKKFVAWLLAFYWLWMGIVYHLYFFTRINPAAWLFGALFILQSYLLIHYSLIRKRLSFQFRNNIYGWSGALLILYALIIYPVIGSLSGHVYPYSPYIGLPCPTTIFTLGLFLWQDKKLPFILLVIPILWSLIGTFAAMYLGIPEDTGLIISGIVVLILMMVKAQKSKALLPAVSKKNLRSVSS